MDEQRPLRVLMVCTGNLCRSPLAEHLLDRVAMTLGVEVEADSGGTLGAAGLPSPRQLVAVAREVGIDLTAHRSKPLRAEQLAWADHVFVMEPEHLAAIAQRFGEDAARKVRPLGPFIGKPQIDDPMGSWFKGPYRRMRDEVERALRQALRELTGSRW